MFDEDVLEQESLKMAQAELPRAQVTREPERLVDYKRNAIMLKVIDAFTCIKIASPRSVNLVTLLVTTVGVWLVVGNCQVSIL